MQSLNEAELPERLIAGDERVLEDILRRYGGAVFALLRSRFQGVLHHEDLEDILSIALYRLWKARSRFDDCRGSLRSWWYRIAENTARDILRAGWQKSRAREISWEFDPGGTNPPFHPPGATGHSGTVRANTAPAPVQMELRDIIAELPDTQRQIILADASARDDVACSRRLAQELGTTPGNIRVSRKRAMDRIRRELGRRGHSSLEIPAEPTP